MESAFTVKTGVFEGPLELLLKLIEKRKLSISEVSLAKVADDFIVYVRNLKDFPIADSANFILIASTLLLIKSKSLLPSLLLSEEEEGSIEDLERRLAIYQKIKELSKGVKEFFGQRIMFGANARLVLPVFSPCESIKLSNLSAAIKEVIRSLPKHEFIPKAVIQKVISLEEVIESLTKRINKNLKMSFKEFSEFGKKDKISIVVGFLAMLELVRQGIINVTQSERFSDIMIETEQIGTPNYIP